MKLSVVVSAYNGEKTIEKCLDSVKKIADEIIVVDNSSTDNTFKLAEKYTSKIFKQQNNPLAIDLLKNLGFEKAKGEWILCIDQDEMVTEELGKEILETIRKVDLAVNGFFIPRKNFIFGKWIKYAGWYPDHQLRLFRRGKGRYQEKHVHEQIKIEGKAEYLKNNIIHNNYQTVDQFIKKTSVYAKNEAEDKIERGYSFSYFDAIRFPLSEFLSRFFARKGYKDGFYGLMLSLFMAFYHFLIFAFIWEKNKFKQVEEKEFVPEFEKEVGEIGKEIKYWLYKSEIKKTNNFFKKIYRNLRKNN